MHLQKAKSSNLAGNNFSVRLRCDVLAHRSTNSRTTSQSAGRSADATISAAGARSRSTWAHKHTNARAHGYTRTYIQAHRYRQLEKNAEIGVESSAALGCPPPIRHVATRRLCLLCLLLIILFLAQKIYESASDCKLSESPNFLTKNKFFKVLLLITSEIKHGKRKMKTWDHFVHVPDFSAANDS